MQKGDALFDSYFRPLSRKCIRCISRITRSNFSVVRMRFCRLLSLKFLLPRGMRAVFIRRRLHCVHGRGRVTLFERRATNSEVLFRVTGSFRHDTLLGCGSIVILARMSHGVVRSFVKQGSRVCASPTIIRINSELRRPFIPIRDKHLAFIKDRSRFPGLSTIT